MDENAQYSKVLSRMQNLCAKRECCSADVLRKAVRLLDGDNGMAAKLVSDLVSEKYVDDLRYSEAFVREKSSLSGWGPVKIGYMLSAKGISRDVIAEALKEIEPDSASMKLENILKAKYKTVREEKDCKLKLLRFALGRGYNYEDVAKAVEKVMKSAL